MKKWLFFFFLCVNVSLLYSSELEDDTFELDSYPHGAATAQPMKCVSGRAQGSTPICVEQTCMLFGDGCRLSVRFSRASNWNNEAKLIIRDTSRYLLKEGVNCLLVPLINALFVIYYVFSDAKFINKTHKVLFAGRKMSIIKIVVTNWAPFKWVCKCNWDCCVIWQDNMHVLH